jgi:SAM-dependent methyltransferase
MDCKAHWDDLYRTKDRKRVSWYQAEAGVSLRLIQQHVPDLRAPIIDVGGGASVLVAQLHAAGYRDLTVLDLSGAAIATAQATLGPAAETIRWIEADILTAELDPGRYTLWHDRALFHFLTDPADRARYVAQARRAVAPGGYLLVASFAEDGPTHCSGLEVVRYSAQSLQAQFGEEFTFLEAQREEHRTPGGQVQAFIYCVCRRRPGVAVSS